MKKHIITKEKYKEIKALEKRHKINEYQRD